VIENLLVCEAENAITVAFEMERVVGVVVLLGVVDWAVGFEDEFVFGAAEVEDEGADWMLPAEHGAGDLLAADGMPESLLCWCHGVAELAGGQNEFVGGAAVETCGCIVAWHGMAP
jgi:hypothetical protein